MNRTVLVTGGTGFIGSYVLEELLKYKYNIILLIRSSTNTTKISEIIQYIKVYNIDKHTINSVFNENKIDYVIHLAGAYKKIHEYSNIEDFIRSNIEFGTKILDKMRRYNVKYFINTGTFFEYKIEHKLLKEEQVKSSYNLYAATKSAFSEILKFYSEKYNIKVLDFKLFSPYGPKDNEDKLIGFIIKNHLNNNFFRMTPCQQKWNWTYVKDVALAYRKGIMYFKNMEKNIETFNIGNNKTYSIREIIDIIESFSLNKNLIVHDKLYNKNEIFYVNCNNDKAKNILKWNPKYSLEHGLKETFEYYKMRYKND